MTTNHSTFELSDSISVLASQEQYELLANNSKHPHIYVDGIIVDEFPVTICGKWSSKGEFYFYKSKPATDTAHADDAVFTYEEFIQMYHTSREQIFL